MIKSIIFDCDGVLVNSEPISNRVLIEMAAGQGVEMDEEFVITHFAGKALKHIFDIIEEKSGSSLPPSFESDFRQRTFEAFSQHLQPVEGIHELLAELDLPYCVASSGPLEKIELNLKVAGLYDAFKHAIFSAYTIGSWKPEPTLFLHAARTMKFDPAYSLVVEDSVAGIQAAKAGNFPVVGLVNKSNRAGLLAEGVPLVNSHRELAEFIAAH